MKKQMLTGTLAALMLIFIAQPASAQAKNGKAGKGRQVKAELNLSIDQEQKMQELRLSHEKEMIKLRADLKMREVEMKELGSEDSPNKKKMYAQIDKIGEAKVKMQKAKLDHRLAVLEILDPEQQKIFKQKRMKRGEGREGRMKNRCEDGRQGRGPGRF